jgi:hypothetical protein
MNFEWKPGFIVTCIASAGGVAAHFTDGLEKVLTVNRILLYESNCIMCERSYQTKYTYTVPHQQDKAVAPYRWTTPLRTPDIQGNKIQWYYPSSAGDLGTRACNAPSIRHSRSLEIRVRSCKSVFHRVFFQIMTSLSRHGGFLGCEAAPGSRRRRRSPCVLLANLARDRL